MLADPGSQSENGIAIDGDGNIGTTVNVDDNDVVLKFSPGGSAIWARELDLGGNGLCISPMIEADGWLYAVGGIDDDVLTLPFDAGDENGGVVKGDGWAIRGDVVDGSKPPPSSTKVAVSVEVVPGCHSRGGLGWGRRRYCRRGEVRVVTNNQ